MDIFHFISIKDYKKDYYNNRKLGICSPQALYDLNLPLFMRTTFEIYKERASYFMKVPLSQLTPEDVLYFLNNAPIRKKRGFNSRTLFFSFLPFNSLPKEVQREIKPLVQLTIKSEKLHTFTPKLAIYGKVKSITWLEIEDPNFLKWVENFEKDFPIFPDRIFSRIPHLALLDVYQILPRDISKSLYVK